MQTFIHKAKQAVYIRIALKPAQQPMISAESLARILLAVNTSFLNFVDAEIQNGYSNQTTAFKKETKLFLAATKLCVAEADFVKLSFALVPDFSPRDYPFKTLANFIALKEACFQLYADTVFTDKIFSANAVEETIKKYSAKQRIGIFKPIYQELVCQEGFVVYFGSSLSSTEKTWLKTADQAVLTNLMPEAVKKPKEAIETYYQLIKTGEENDLFGKRPMYKKVLVKETARHDVYPYQLKKVKVGQNVVFLNRQLSVQVVVKDGLYHIGMPELHIQAKAQNRAEAEHLFDAALAKLLEQFIKGTINGNDQKAKSLFLKLQELLA